MRATPSFRLPISCLRLDMVEIARSVSLLGLFWSLDKLGNLLNDIPENL